jgi:subtilisin family serine protease
MFRASRSISTHQLYVSLAVCYVLLVSVIGPVRLGAAEARLNTEKNYSSVSRTLRTTVQQHSLRSRGGELLVRFREGVSEQQKVSAAASQGAHRKKRLRGESGFEKLELSGGQDPETVSRRLLLNPAVEFAEPNFLINKDQVTPSDPSFIEQWALRNTGQNGGQFGSDINVTAAWQTGTGSRATVIAVIDSGIDFTHPDLSDNQWTNVLPGPEGDLHGWDYVTESEEIKDEHGHGTAVAGIIAAQGNNATGISGVMWRASLMSLRVLDNTGTGDIAMAVEAIDYAVTQRRTGRQHFLGHIRRINCSQGCDSACATPKPGGGMFGRQWKSESGH